MPGIDELLRSEGERWRAEVDARRPSATAGATELVGARTAPGRLRRVLAHRPPAGRLLLWSASACAAAALFAGLLALGGGTTDDSASSSSSRAAAGGAAAAAAPAVNSAASSPGSCVAPTLGVEAGAAGSGSSRAAGSSQPPVRVTAGQLITVTGVHYVPPTCEQATPPPTAQDAVTLRLRTADGRTTTLLRAQPVRADNSFRVRVTIPPGAAPGAATLDDGRGHVVRLTILAR